MSTRNLLPAPEPIHDAEHVDELLEMRDRISELEKNFHLLAKEVAQLTGLLRSARITFGTPSTPQETGAVGNPDRWARTKEKLGGKKAEVIQALQDHGFATRSQLRAITGSGMSTVDAVTANLRDMGLIIKVGDSWKLKE